MPIYSYVTVYLDTSPLRLTDTSSFEIKVAVLGSALIIGTYTQSLTSIHLSIWIFFPCRASLVSTLPEVSDSVIEDRLPFFQLPLMLT